MVSNIKSVIVDEQEFLVHNFNFYGTIDKDKNSIYKRENMEDVKKQAEKAYVDEEVKPKVQEIHLKVSYKDLNPSSPPIEEKIVELQSRWLD